jgi:tellurite resistance protein
MSLLKSFQNAISGIKAMADQKMNETVANGSMAIAASVAAADGSIDESELDAVHEVITGEDIFKAQDQDLLCEIFDKYANSMKSPLKKRNVTKAITALAGRSDDDRETAFLVGLEIAAADGNVDNDEKATLRQIAEMINVNYNKLMGDLA